MVALRELSGHGLVVAGAGVGRWWHAGRGLVLAPVAPVRLARPTLANAFLSYSS